MRSVADRDFAAVRRFYGVPAKRGARVCYTGDGGDRAGVITSVGEFRVWIRFDGDAAPSGPFHPTWALEYLP